MFWTDLDSFVADYLAVWHENDDTARHALVDRLWAESTRLFNHPHGTRLTGIEAVRADVDRVNRDDVRGRGHTFHPTAVIPNGNAVSLDWNVLDRTGATLSSGRDFLVRDPDGRITALYQFFGPHVARTGR